jgi:hypothetical protein
MTVFDINLYCFYQSNSLSSPINQVSLESLHIDLQVGIFVIMKKENSLKKLLNSPTPSLYRKQLFKRWTQLLYFFPGNAQSSTN